MLVSRNRNFILVLRKYKLSVVNSLTLNTFHTQECVGGVSLACSEEYAFVGTSTGSILVLNLFNLEETLISSMKAQITSLFYLDGFLYCGGEDGTIYTYRHHRTTDTISTHYTNPVATCKTSLPTPGTSSSGCPHPLVPNPGCLQPLDAAGRAGIEEPPNEMFSSGTNAVLTLVRSSRHPAPVSQICTDGVETLVADMRGKVVLYPSGGMYDMKKPLFRYKNYVFASEGCMVYCRTRSAFAVWVTLEEAVEDYQFSRNGGVLFARCGRMLYAIDFNKRCVVKEMEVESAFVYDDDKDRIVIFGEDDQKRVIEDVLEKEYAEMCDVKFREDGIVERRKNGVEDEEKGEQRKYHRSEENLIRLETPRNERTVGIERFVIESSEEEEAQANRALCTLPLETEDGCLLCYNAEGYMVFLRVGNISRVEVCYHDATRKKIEINGIDECTMGSFCGENIILGTESKIIFVCGVERWEKHVKICAFAISEKFVAVASSEFVKMFRFDGVEIFNCLIPDVRMMCCSKNKIALFGKELFIVDLFRSTERMFLPRPVRFACFDEEERIFYAINNELYYMYKGLSVKMCDIIGNPLVVSFQCLISLMNTKRLNPRPHTNHKKLFDDVKGAVLLNSSLFLEETPSVHVEDKDRETKENQKTVRSISQRAGKYNPLQ